MNKRIALNLTRLAFLSTVALLATRVVSAEECTTQYGNGQYGTTTCRPTDLSIDKQVRNPITGVFVENLLSGDASYAPNSEVIFSLKVTNSSNQNFRTVQITDTLPERMVNPKVDEPDQTKVTDVKNPDNRTLVFLLKEELKSGQSVEVKIKATVVSTFPTDKSRFCGDLEKLQNNAEVKAEDRSDPDSASICVETTNVLGATTLPQAGPEDYLPLLPFIALGITGIALIFRKPAIRG
jgi:hypothetical protein